MEIDKNRVLTGFLRLATDEQKTVYEEIRQFMQADTVQKYEIKEALRKSGVILGPTNPSGCPCCGR